MQLKKCNLHKSCFRMMKDDLDEGGGLIERFD